MAVCKLKEEQLLQLYKVGGAYVKETIKEGSNLDIKPLVELIYNKALSKTNDRAKALSYALVMPEIFNDVLSLKSEYEDYAIETNFDYAPLKKLAYNIRKASDDTVLDVIAEFLGQVPFSKQIDSAKETVEAQQKTDAQNNAAQAPVTLNFSAKPNTLFSTTGQQSIPGENIPDPSMSFYYDILKRLNVNNLNTEGGVSYEGVEGGLYITIISGQNIEDSEMYTRDSGKREDYNKNFFLVLTNKNGDAVYFDQKYKVVTKESGKPIYYPLRTDAESTAQPAKVTDQLNALRDAAKYIKKDPKNRKVVNKITGKSIGYINTSNKVQYTAIDTIQNNSDFVFVPHNGKLYLSVRNGTQGPIEVIMKPFSQERANLIASLIVDDIYQDGQLMTASEKYNILNSWLDNGKGIYFTTKKGNLVVKINGTEVNLSDKENAKTQIVNQLTKEFTVSGRQVKEKFKAKLKLLNDKIPMFDLVESNGQLTYSENLIPYQDYLRQVTLARVFVNENNTVTPLNGYFTYELGNRVESKPETPVIQEEVVDLGSKTAPAGSKVVIDATKGKSPQTGAVVAFRTKGKTEQNMIDALDDLVVGNPFGPYAAIKTKADGEAVTRFLNWLKGAGDTDVMQDYRNALLAKVPELKGKTIYYYKDLGRPSHATALDYFLNGPVTQKSTQQSSKVEVKEGVSELFESNPELAAIGTPEQYSQYLDTIFPDSKIKDIVYHGSDRTFDKFSMKTLGDYTGSPSAKEGFFFTNNKRNALEYLPSDPFNTEIIRHDSDRFNLELEKIYKEMSKEDQEKYFIVTDYRGADGAYNTMFSIKPKYKKEIYNTFKNREALKFSIILKQKETGDPFAPDQIINEAISYEEALNYIQETRSEGYGAFGGNLFQVILNIKNPIIHTQKNQRHRDKSYIEIIKEGKDKNKDSAIIKNTMDPLPTDIYSVFEPEQIHILGGKQDIEGFKEFVNAGDTKVTTPEQQVVDEVETPKDIDISLDDLDQSNLDALLESSIKQKGVGTVATPEQIKKALAWYNSITLPNGKKLSDVVPVMEMFNAVNASNPNAIAHWSMAGITLFEGSDYSDLYHEAWHAFTQQFLSKADRDALYNSLRKKTDSFVDYNGNTVQFKDATRLQLEEYLAEEFREFMLRDGKGKYTKQSVIGKIFSKIRELLLWLFNRTTYYDVYNNNTATKNISELFNQLRVGNLTDPINEVDQEFARKGLNRTIKTAEGDSFTMRDSVLIRESVDSLFSEFVGKVNEKTGTKAAAIQLQLNEDFQRAAYEYARKRMVQQRANLIKQHNNLLKKNKDNYTLEIYQKLSSTATAIKLLSRTLEEFVIPAKGEKLSQATGVIRSHQQLSTYLKEAKELEEQIQLDLLNNNTYADRSGNSESFEKLTDNKLMYTLGGVFERDSNGNVVKNELGFNKIMNPRIVFNRLGNILETNEPMKRASSIPNLYKKMLEIASEDKFMEDVLNRLGNPETTNTLVNNNWTSFSVLILPVVHVYRAEVVLDESGNINSVNLVDASLEKQQIIRNFGYLTKYLDPNDPNNYIYEDVDRNNFIDLNRVFEKWGSASAAKNDPYNFLTAIGVYLPNIKDVKDTLETAEFKKHIGYLWRAAKKINTYNNSKETKESRKISVEGFKDIVARYQNLGYANEVREKKLPEGQSKEASAITKLYLKYSDQSNNLSITTVDQKAKFQRSLPNTLTKKADFINDADSWNALTSMPQMENLDTEKNPFMKTSLIAKALFGENLGSRISETGIFINDLDGIKLRIDQEDLDAVRSADSDPGAKLLLDVITTLKFGSTEATRHAGKSSTFLIEVVRKNGEKHYVSLDKFYKTNKGFNQGLLETVKIYEGYLASEFERIFKAKTDPANKRVLTGSGKTLAEAGSDFVIFKDIIPQKLQDKLIALQDQGVQTVEDLEIHLDENPELRRDLQNAIYNYLQEQINVEVADYKALNTKDKFNKKLFGFKKVDGKLVPVTIEEGIAAYTMNSMIHNMETGLLLYGDPAIYKWAGEDYHKRNAGAGSTGIAPRTDTYFQNFINTKGGIGTNGLSQRDYDGSLNTVVLADSKVKSQYLDEYIKAAQKQEEERLKGKPKKEITAAKKRIKTLFEEAYADMEEADAQGYITLDAYRALSWGMNKWTAKQEVAYQKIKNNEIVDDLDVQALFPVRKYQYWGPIKTEGLAAEAFHKFSLLPLIPQVTKNAPGLDALRVKMEAEQIDYLTFKSGSKLAIITNKKGKLDNLYKGDPKNRELGLPATFTKGVVYADFLKEQLSIAPKFKGEVVFSTQLRKLILEGIWEEGKPVGSTDKEKQEVVSKTKIYETAVNNLTEVLFKELKEKAGIDTKTGFITNKAKLIGYLANALENKEVPNHIIEQVASMKVRLAEGVNLDLLTNSQDLETLLTTLVYKKVINQKVLGEGLVQVSAAGWSKSYDDNLKFYRVENGVTKPMQVKIAIQGPFKQLLNHPDVLEKAQQEDITPLQALNALLKDKAWLDKDNNREMITLMGPRIPVQGLNSMEVMEVAEFLPEAQATVIVLPSEIVGKSGSDFDVDKLSIVFPAIKTYNGVPQAIKFNAELAKTTSRKELTNEIIELQKTKSDVFKYQKELLKFIKDDTIFTPSERASLEVLYAEHEANMQEINNKIKPLERQWQQSGGAEALLQGVIPDDYSLEGELLNLYAEKSRMQQAFRSNRYFYKKTFISQEIEQDLNLLQDQIDKLTFQRDSISPEAAATDVLKATIDIILLPQNFVSLITPNTTLDAKDLSDKMNDQIDFGYSSKNNFQEENKGFKATRIYELKYNRMKLDYNKVGKDALGIGAVDNTFNVLFNRIGAYLVQFQEIDKDYSRKVRIVGMQHNQTENGEISLSHRYDAAGKRKIADIINQFINGWVDVEKNEWIFFIQGNKELSGALLFLTQAGVPLEEAVYFLNQPIVRDFYNRLRKKKSAISGVTRETTNKFNKNLVFDELMGQQADYYMMLNDARSEGKSVKKSSKFTFIKKLIDKNPFDSNYLEKNINSKGVYNDKDYAVLGHFVEVLENANGVTDLKTALNFDTNRQSSIEEIRSKLRIRGKAYSIFPEKVVNDILNETVLGSFNIQRDVIRMYTPLFPVKLSAGVAKYIDKNYETIQTFANEETTYKVDELIEIYRNTIVPYLFQKSYYSIDENNTRGYKIEYSGEFADRVIGISSEDPNTLVINKKAVLDLINKNRFASEATMLNFGIAPVPQEIFQNIDTTLGYTRYLIEREVIRKQKENSIEAILKSDVFKNYLDILKEQLKTKDLSNLTGQLKISREDAIKMIAYEHVIRDRALDNLNFTNRLFFDHKNSRTSYASQIQDVIKKYPQLMSKFTVLNALEFRSRTIAGNIKERNIKLKDTRVPRETLEIFASEIVRLGNNAELLKVKGVNEEDASIISALFKRFHVFAYLQSGANPSSSTFNLLPIANPTVIEQLLAKPVQDFVEMDISDQEEIAKKVYEQIQKYYRSEIQTGEGKRFNKNKLYTHKALNTETFPIEKQSIIILEGQKAHVVIEIDENGKVIGYKPSRNTPSEDVIKQLNNYKDDFALVIDAPASLLETGEIPNTGIGKLLKSNTTVGLANLEMKDNRLEDNKISIDGSIEHIKESLGDRQLVFRTSGQAQELKETAPKTFEYLSRRLKEEFGYTNPGSVPENVEVKEPVQVDSYITEEKNVFTVKPNKAPDMKKAPAKAKIATQFIGFAEGIRNSSTGRYAEQAGEYANTGKYSESDVIFVSILGQRKNYETVTKEQQDKTIREAIKALNAGATIIADNKAYIDSNNFNTGEWRLHENLKRKGYNYTEVTVDGQKLGVWRKKGYNTSITNNLTNGLISTEGLNKVQVPLAEVFTKDVFNEEDSQKVFDFLEKLYAREYDEKHKASDKFSNVRRSMYFSETSYTYSGVTRPANPGTESLKKLVNRVTERLGFEKGYFDMVLINEYKNGEQKIGFHTDDEPILNNEGKLNPSVVTISFGDERTMILKDNQGREYSIPMPSGLGLVMGYNGQKNYKHGIKAENNKSKRFSITLRHNAQKSGAVDKTMVQTPAKVSVPLTSLDIYNSIIDEIKSCGI